MTASDKTETPFVVSDEYYIAVGRMTLAWVTVEMPLDFITGVLFVRAGGAELEQEIPVSLKRKVKFCRKGFAQLEPVKIYNETATLILNEIVRLAAKRHRLIHGLVDNFTPVRTGEIRINKIRYGKHTHEVETISTSLPDLDATTQEIIALGQGGLLLVNELAKKYRIAEQPME